MLWWLLVPLAIIIIVTCCILLARHRSSTEEYQVLEEEPVSASLSKSLVITSEQFESLQPSQVALLCAHVIEADPRLPRARRCFAVVSFGTQVFRTQVSAKSKFPLWSEKARVQITRPEQMRWPIRIAVYQKRRTRSNQLLGAVQVPLESLLKRAATRASGTDAFSRDAFVLDAWLQLRDAAVRSSDTSGADMKHQRSMSLGTVMRMVRSDGAVVYAPDSSSDDDVEQVFLGAGGRHAAMLPKVRVQLVLMRFNAGPVEDWLWRSLLSLHADEQKRVSRESLVLFAQQCLAPADAQRVLATVQDEVQVDELAEALFVTRPATRVCPCCLLPLSGQAREDKAHLLACAYDASTQHEWALSGLLAEHFATRRWANREGTEDYVRSRPQFIVVVDRATGRLVSERIPGYLRLVLRMMYQSRVGISLPRVLKRLTYKYGARYDSAASRRDIANFVRYHKISLNEISAASVDHFASFNDFFYRRLRKGARPIDGPPPGLGFRLAPAAVVTDRQAYAQQVSQEFWPPQPRGRIAHGSISATGNEQWEYHGVSEEDLVDPNGTVTAVSDHDDDGDDCIDLTGTSGTCGTEWYWRGLVPRHLAGTYLARAPAGQDDSDGRWRRTVSLAQRILVSPADCRLTVFDSISDARRLWIKGRRFSLSSMLGDSALVADWASEEASLVLCRLAPQDYHRFHCPLDAVQVGHTRDVSGRDPRFHSVNPLAVRSHRADVLSENKRVVTPMRVVGRSERHDFLYIAVGACCVGSVALTSLPGEVLQRGDEHGFFAFGGSTIVLVFRKGVVRFDADLVRNSQRHLETYVRMGQRIGVLDLPDGTGWDEADQDESARAVPVSPVSSQLPLGSDAFSVPRSLRDVVPEEDDDERLQSLLPEGQFALDADSDQEDPEDSVALSLTQFGSGSTAINGSSRAAHFDHSIARTNNCTDAADDLSVGSTPDHVAVDIDVDTTDRPLI
ncbi:MAG: hypothetical protein MHM6MM_003938 [Cercozoa sp. M6MM]